ncbi:hypothetical protein LguiA_003155 [Lonicera macranthoides]
MNEHIRIEGVVADSEDFIKSSADALGMHGFINYFSLQVLPSIFNSLLLLLKPFPFHSTSPLHRAIDLLSGFPCPVTPSGCPATSTAPWAAYTALHTATHGARDQATSRGHIDFVKALLQHKPDLVNESNSWLRAPLHLASANGQVEMVKLLLDANKQMPGDSNAAKIREQLVKAGDLNTETLLSPLEPNTTQLRRGEINQINAKKMQRVSVIDAKTPSRDVVAKDNKESRIEKKRDALLVTATLIAGMAYQARLKPPGGVWDQNDQIILRCRSQHSPITYTRLTSLGDNLVLRFETKGVHVVFNWRHMGDGHIHGRNLPIRNVSHYTNFQWESAAGIVCRSENTLEGG